MVGSLSRVNESDYILVLTLAHDLHFSVVPSAELFLVVWELRYHFNCHSLIKQFVLGFSDFSELTSPYCADADESVSSIILVYFINLFYF